MISLKTIFKICAAGIAVMLIYSLGNPDKSGSKEIDFNIFQKYLLNSESVKKNFFLL
jgi:hypothetical protein